MTHDHTRITALVDDELDQAARERVLAHVTSCADCRAFYLQERAAKRALASGDSDAADQADGGPSAALMRSLYSMADPGEPLSLARQPRPPVDPRPLSRPRTLPDQHSRRARRAAKGVGLSLLGVTVLGAVAFALGGSDDEPVQPPVTRYAQEHARTSAQQPLDDSSVDVLKTSVGAGP